MEYLIILKAIFVIFITAMGLSMCGFQRTMGRDELESTERMLRTVDRIPRLRQIPPPPIPPRPPTPPPSANTPAFTPTPRPMHIQQLYQPLQSTLALTQRDIEAELNNIKSGGNNDDIF